MAGKGNYAKGKGPKPLNAGFKAKVPAGKPKEPVVFGPRPMVEYSDELWRSVLEEIAVGCTPGSIEKIKGMPSASTILNWRKKSPEHMAQYDAAAKVRCVAFVEQAVDECRNSRNDMIERLGYKGPEPRMEVNGEVLGRSRLIVDTLLRVAAIYEPRFAPKSRHEVVGKDDGPVQILSSTVKFVDP